MILISISHIPNTGKGKYLAGYSIRTFKNPDKLLEKDGLVTKKSLPLPTVAGMNWYDLLRMERISDKSFHFKIHCFNNQVSGLIPNTVSYNISGRIDYSAYLISSYTEYQYKKNFLIR